MWTTKLGQGHYGDWISGIDINLKYHCVCPSLICSLSLLILIFDIFLKFHMILSVPSVVECCGTSVFWGFCYIRCSITDTWAFWMRFLAMCFISIGPKNILCNDYDIFEHYFRIYWDFLVWDTKFDPFPFLAPPDIVSRADQIGTDCRRPSSVVRPSVRPSVVNNLLKRYLLLQFSINQNKILPKVRTHQGAKIVGSRIFDLGPRKILGVKLIKILRFLKIYLLLQFLFNPFQTLLKYRTTIGAKIVGSGILNFGPNFILGANLSKFDIYATYHLIFWYPLLGTL